MNKNQRTVAAANAKPLNKAAQKLGRMAAGVPKDFSKAEIKRRTKRLAEARAKRWAGHKKKATGPQVVECPPGPGLIEALRHVR